MRIISDDVCKVLRSSLALSRCLGSGAAPIHFVFSYLTSILKCLPAGSAEEEAGESGTALLGLWPLPPQAP